MSIKQDIQKINNRVDSCQRKLDAAKARGDNAMVSKFTDDLEKLSKTQSSLKHKQQYDLNKERRDLSDMPFSREITKLEQADLGQLKKKVKGLVIVHPMTKIGKQLRVDVMTGFAPKPF
ncbi:YibL family ribosome-associated protein [Vibrio sinensis]|uniref:YibL family ribosome-associated protein n=1 Tax=Vibrio sinensis TaxID=2302434 RepID=A0A3A6QHW2_9VIBR|nr:YibL family ribosome-associated protein [Vibrio sinensis]RJX66222.1 YibL family ribosome-associated protein [Vibrio sinensis]